MTHLEAIQSVEKRLTDMGIKDCFGDPVTGLECIGLIAKFHGQLLTEVENSFESGALDPESYDTAMGMLIDEYNRFRLRNQVEKMLVNLRNEQGGAA